MKTLSALIEDLTVELGYNPYDSFKTPNGIVRFVDTISDNSSKDLYNAVVYQSAKAVRQMPLHRFFEFAKPVAFDDLYIVALMIEIYRRTHTVSSVNRFYFSASQYIEFSDWQDLLSALEQLKPHYVELQSYKGIESGIPQSYQSMSDQHLLNAWFQRVLNEVTSSGKSYDFCDMRKLVLESPQVDGLISFVKILATLQ